MQRQSFYGNKLVLIPLLLGLMSTGFTNPDLAKKVFPPHKIKSTIASVAPTGLTPDQVKRAYGFGHLPFQGEGQTIAIVSAFDNPNLEADFDVFNTTFNLPTCTTANGCFTKLYVNNQQPAGNANWGAESALDIQWAHAIAPRAKIILIEAANETYGALFAAVNLAVQSNASVISLSWGGVEFPGELAFDANFNAPGITFVAAAGDTGTGTLYPAVSPNVIAVGGTSLSVDADGNFLNETAWDGSGGGASAYETMPAYQASFPIPSNPNSMRAIPDVAYAADPAKGFSVYDTYGFQGWLTIGGTSAGAPQWAALAAIMKSGSHKKLTAINSLLYNAAQQPKYRLNYNDVITGTNGACGNLCTAQAGYDYVTGLGSPQALYLAYDVIVNGFKK